MKNTRKFSKIVAAIVVFAMVLSLASCFGGALKLESFTVDRTSVKTVYLIGEKIDFSGIKATAKYSDPSLNKVYTFDELHIDYPSDITATAGTKEVTVSFDDPNLKVKQETKVSIKVTDGSESNDPQTLTSFERPTSFNAFASANAAAGKSDYSDGAFSGEFAVGGQTYLIGDDNPFILLPNAIALGDSGLVNLKKVYSKVELYLEKDGSYVALTATAGEGNLVKFYDGETLIATVDTRECTYQFTADAVDSMVKISVLPSPEHYTNATEYSAVVLEAKVIDAYNVYEAWQLAVIDNDDTEYRGTGDDTNIWDELKTQNGLTDVEVSGVVLHNDIKITANDVPAKFFLTTTKDTVYTNATTGETTTVPAGTKYLKDWSEIYRRVLNVGESFTFEGNLFTIDVSTFPTVASPGVFGTPDDSSDDYSNDFSNSTFVKFVSLDGIETEERLGVTMRNVHLIGNASRNNLIDADEYLVSAGGLIFVKTTRQVALDCNNITGNSFFITYFTEQGSKITANNIKCYDSYQNATYSYGNSEMEFNNSFLNGAGGPVVILASAESDTVGVYTTPKFVSNNTIIETHLSGEEIWFDAVKAKPVVAEITALGNGLHTAGLGNFVDSTGKMNIRGILMAEGANASEILGGYGASGSISLNGNGISRLPDDATWQTICYLYQANPATIQAPFLTVKDAQGNSHTLFYAGQEIGLCDLTGAQFNPDPTKGGSMEHLAIAQAFMAADSITLTQAGMSVVFDFYHY